MYRVLGFEIVAPYTLRVEFDDATQQLIDLSQVLRGSLYGPLRDAELFNRVAVDPEAQTLVWPNGADFGPATLHDWPDCGAAFIEMASRWNSASAWNSGGLRVEPVRLAWNNDRSWREGLILWKF